MDIIDRISEICSDKKIKPAFLHKSGVAASQTVYDVLKRKQKPGIQFISKFLELFPDVNGDWLMKGTGNRYISSVDDSESSGKGENSDYISGESTTFITNEKEAQYHSKVEKLEKRIIELEAKLEEKEKFIRQLLGQLKK